MCLVVQIPSGNGPAAQGTRCPQCCWVKGVHFNPDGASQGLAAMGGRAGEMAPEHGRSRGAAAEQAVGAASLAQDPRAAPGLSSAGCCQWVPLGISRGVSLGAAACAAVIGYVPVLRQRREAEGPQ